MLIYSRIFQLLNKKCSVLFYGNSPTIYKWDQKSHNSVVSKIQNTTQIITFNIFNFNFFLNYIHLHYFVINEKNTDLSITGFIYDNRSIYLKNSKIHAHSLIIYWNTKQKCKYASNLTRKYHLFFIQRWIENWNTEVYREKGMIFHSYFFLVVHLHKLIKPSAMCDNLQENLRIVWIFSDRAEKIALLYSSLSHLLRSWSKR